MDEFSLPTHIPLSWLLGAFVVLLFFITIAKTSANW
jgi:hypothetical protein